MLIPPLALALALAAASPGAPAPAAAKPDSNAPPAAQPPPAPSAAPAPAAPTAKKPPHGEKVELAEPVKAALLAQAAQMSAAAVSGDHARFLGFMYPRLVEDMGGPAAVEKALREGEATMKQQGAQIIESRVAGVRGCAKVAAQLQCVLDQHQRLRIPQGVIRADGDLIAFSEDGGRRWTFLGAAQSEQATRETVPELAAELPLRTPTAPTLEK